MKATLPVITSITLLLILVAIVRVITLPIPELTDTSEGRFASVAQEMLLSGNWVTPQIYKGEPGWEPYWAKPPFHIWSAALSMAVLGENSFAARLPSLLGALIICFIMYQLALRLFGRVVGLRTIIILCSTAGFFALSGLCLTDMLLAAGITGTSAAIALALFTESTEQSRRAWLLAALASGIGMLIKGPVSVVLPGFALTLFLALQALVGAPILNHFRRIPWILSFVIFFLVWIPWFLLAELRTPGFLRYYFVHENFLRYVQSNLDIQYGTGHREPYGTIWLYWIGMSLPWSFVLPFTRLNISMSGVRTWLQQSPRETYLLAWVLASPLFFTMARQVLPTYVLSSLPALSLLFALYFDQHQLQKLPLSFSRGLTFILLGTGIVGSVYGCIVLPSLAAWLLLIAVGGIVTLYPRLTSSDLRVVAVVLVVTFGSVALLSERNTRKRSAGPIIALMAQRGTELPQTVGALLNNPRSGVFYGRAVKPIPITVIGGLTPSRALELGIKDLIVQTGNVDELPDDFKARLTEEGTQGAWVWYKVSAK